MKIGIIGSMNFSEKMLEVANQLKGLGYQPILSSFVHTFTNRNEEDKEVIKLKQKFEEDAMKKDWNMMKGADSFLVINIEKHGIENYIGGNTLFEIAGAYFDNKKIYFLNPIPNISFYKSELEAINPVVLNGDLKKIE